MIGPGGQPGSPGPGYETINKFGANYDIDSATVPEGIWTTGGPFIFLDAGIQADLVSTSANDTLLGSGAQKVKVTYYLSDNTKVVEIKDMAGVGRVQLSDDFKFCSTKEIEQSGAGKTNAGQIKIVDRATGLIIYQSIAIGEGRTLSSAQICEKGKKCTVVKHFATYAKSQSPLSDADLRFNLRKVDGSVIVVHPATVTAVKPVDEYSYPIGGIEMSEGEIIFWECIDVGANDTPIEARFDVKTEDV